jgi:CSLREA domain-containing protein
MGTMARTLIGVSLATLVASVPPAWADTYVVNSTADAVDATPGNGSCATAGGVCTLRAAIQEANAHAGPDIVSLPAGEYLLTIAGAGEDLGATGDLDVSDPLEVNGAGQATTVIDALYLDRILQATTTFALRDVTLRRGAATNGGGLYLNNAFARTIERVLFEKNLATDAAAINQTAGDLTITDSTFERNNVTGDAGALLMLGAGNLAITGSTFASNGAPAGAGGGVLSAATGTATVTNSTFSQNTADTGAGLFVVGASSLTVTGSTFEHNVAVSAAGGLYGVTAGDVTISGTSLMGNFASAYAATLISAGTTVQVTGGEASDNVAVSGYAGMFLMASAGASVDGTAVRRNAGGTAPGAGLFVSTTSNTIAIVNVEATENSGGPGGGIFASTGGSITFANTRVLNNGASAGPGGGVFLSATNTVAVTDSTISGNIAGGVAGGLYAASGGAMSIQGSTVSGNRSAGAGGVGGGIFVSAGAPSVLTNTTVSGNVADVQGGGLYAAGTLTLRNATFVDNGSPLGSAIFNGGALTSVSTIISGAAASHCAGAALVSGGNNIDSTGTCALAGAGDQIVDPQLGPLADNGGPTLTHLPASTSPALDTGAATGCPATDQRGETRPTDGNGDGTSACDVGAVEFLDLCLDDPAKVVPGICGCGVADTDANLANGTADCLINGELKARIARAKTIIGALAGDADPLEAELGTIGESLPTYVSQFKAQIQLVDPNAKTDKLAKKARKKIKKVGKAKAGAKLDKAKTKANTALDALDAAVAPQA